MNEIRNFRGEMSVFEYCSTIGVSRQTLIRWENDFSVNSVPDVIMKNLRAMRQFGLTRFVAESLPKDFNASRSVKLEHPEKFPDQIRQLRANTGMDRCAFCDRYAIGYETLKNWELGRRTPPGYVAFMLMRLINEHDAKGSGQPVEIAFI